MSIRTNDVDRFALALRRFDEANGQDPNIELVSGNSFPRELLYAQRLYEWVIRLAPRASEPLLLASRSQHLCRWMIPRSNYEMTRAGYLKWRNDLKTFHASRAADILKEVGYPEPLIEAVHALNLKKNFPHDPDSQVLEDALCLVFLQYQFAPLARKTTDEKMINALRKSWNKMTPTARAEALRLPFEENEARLLKLALQSE